MFPRPIAVAPQQVEKLRAGDRPHHLRCLSLVQPVPQWMMGSETGRECLHILHTILEDILQQCVDLWFGLGCQAYDLKKRCHALQDLGDIQGKPVQLADGIRFIEHSLGTGSLQQGDGLLVASHGDVDQPGKDRAFIAEDHKDRLRRHAGCFSDGTYAGSAVAAFQKELLRSLQDLQAGFLRLRLAPSGVVCAFDLGGHFPLDNLTNWMYYIYIQYSITVLYMAVNYRMSVTDNFSQHNQYFTGKKEYRMSTEGNKNALRQVIEEAFNKGNYAVLHEIFNPDFVEHQFGLHPTIEGMQGDIQFLRTAFPDFTLTIEEMLAQGDQVWVRMTARGTNLGGFMGPPNGKSIRITVIDICRFEDGKIVEHWGVPDRFALLAQLGLLPQAQPQGV